MAQDIDDGDPEEKWVIVADDTLRELTQEEREKYLTPEFMAGFIAELNADERKRNNVRKKPLRHGGKRSR